MRRERMILGQSLYSAYYFYIFLAMKRAVHHFAHLPDLDINNILGAGAVGHPRLVWGAVQSDEGGDEILRKPRKNSIHKSKTAIGQIRIHPYG